MSKDKTFFYVKEHQQHTGQNDRDTLFVANCPVYPSVKTKKLLLTSIFGRFGDVRRVTVVPYPRRGVQGKRTEQDDQITSSGCWMSNFEEPSYFL